MISVGAESVVKATIDASAEIHVQGQYVQNQNVYNVSSMSPELQVQLEGQGEQVQQLGQAVQKLLEQHQLQHRELRAGDSLSIRNDNERQLVKQLVARYRALPEADRKEVPALLHAVGKLEVVSGDFDAASRDFQAVAQLEQENKARAEAHYHAYIACLEQRDWWAAIQELVKAIKLDAKRFAPFPVGKYQPVRILGAGGFGVAFLCKHKYMDAQVVVKTLTLEELGRDADKVFTEARVLRQLDHPAVIRISDCGYADAARKSRPYLVMDYFAPGMTLEQHVKKHGPLDVDALLAVARQVAEGLQSAHAKGILHRDVKPANLLVRDDPGGWRVKVIDFGLALRQKVVQRSMNASTDNRGKTPVGGGTGGKPLRSPQLLALLRAKTLVGGSIAGTQGYAAPEQMGRRDEEVGTYSDVYGWAKTCCYALFETTQPTLRHWQSVPGQLADLLGRCLEEDPRRRPQGFAEVLKGLNIPKEIPIKEDSPSRPSPERRGRVEGKPERAPEPRERPRKRQRPSRPVWEGWRWWLAGGAAAAVLALMVGTWLLVAITLRVRTPEGTLLLEIDPADAEVSVDGRQVTVKLPSDQEAVQMELPAGQHELKVTKGGFETFTREFTLRAGKSERVTARLLPEKRPNPVPLSSGEPKDSRAELLRPAPLDCTGPDGLTAAKVRQAQEAWARYLGRQVEETVEVGDGVQMTFVLVPPGKFRMGSPPNEMYRNADETLHEVTLTEPFDLGKTEVTQAQYQALTGKNPSQFKGADRPVEQVSWDEAVAYGKRLTTKLADRYSYRLPTEAEWEYGCRAGTTTAYFTGDEQSRKRAGWCTYNGEPDSLAETKPVAQLQPNAWGLYDMHGNVFEWCADRYGPYSRGDVINPTGPVKGSEWVIRGGCFRAYPGQHRAACRGHFANPYQNLGFRLVRNLPPRGK
jgi:formylglycine-generating enzyme required for sulfatase activity/serine/threonine protein kinase